MILIDGKTMQDEIKIKLREEIESKGIEPKLTIVQVGDISSSNTYINQKITHCKSIGIKVELITLFSHSKTEDVKNLIYDLNKDSNVDGIIVQLPLPNHMEERDILDSIDINKDVDGLSSLSIGLLHSRRQKYEPCTPAGIMEMLKKYNIDVTGKRCLVIGRSHIVGSPIQEMLTQANGTVTMIHSKSKFHKSEYSNYDIIVVAVGKMNFITNEDIKLMKPGVVLIDVGINFDNNFKMCGDITKELTEESKNIIGYLTPVPGGVGRTTVAKLMENVVRVYR